MHLPAGFLAPGMWLPHFELFERLHKVVGNFFQLAQVGFRGFGSGDNRKLYVHQ